MGLLNDQTVKNTLGKVENRERTLPCQGFSLDQYPYWLTKGLFSNGVTHKKEKKKKKTVTTCPELICWDLFQMIYRL